VPVANRSARRRTCIGCRERASKTDLLRVVLSESVVIPDFHQRHHGRGAYLHRERGCLDSALQRQAFGRALRASGPVSFVQVEQAIPGNSSTTNLGSQSGDEMSTQ